MAQWKVTGGMMVFQGACTETGTKLSLRKWCIFRNKQQRRRAEQSVCPVVPSTGYCISGRTDISCQALIRTLLNLALFKRSYLSISPGTNIKLYQMLASVYRSFPLAKSHLILNWMLSCSSTHSSFLPPDCTWCSANIEIIWFLFYQHVSALLKSWAPQSSKAQQPFICSEIQKCKSKLVTCLWGPLRMCARAPSHAVLIASIEGVPNRSVIKSSYRTPHTKKSETVKFVSAWCKKRTHHHTHASNIAALAILFSDIKVMLSAEWDLPAEWDSGLGRGCVSQGAQRRCSPQTRYQWSWSSGGSPWGSLELCSTVSPLLESCAVTHLTPPLGQGQNHRSGNQSFRS